MYEPPHWTKPRLARIARKSDEASEQKARETLAQDGIMVVGSEAADMIADLSRVHISGTYHKGLLRVDEAGLRPPDEPTIADLQKQVADMKKAYNALWAESMNMLSELTRRDWGLDVVNGTLPKPEPTLTEIQKQEGLHRRPMFSDGQFHIDGRQDRN